MKRSVLYKPIYREVAGELSYGILLSQLVYWCAPGKTGVSRLRVQRGGRFWLVKTRRELSEETGLSDKEVKLGLSKLRKLGLIATMGGVSPFNSRICNFIYLNFDRLSVLVDWALKAQSTGPLSTSLLGPKGPPIYIDSCTENPHIDSVAVPATACEDGGTNSKEGEEKEMGEITGKEYLKKSGHKLDKGNKQGSAALANLWKERLAVLIGGFQKELTKKEEGQLSLFHGKVREEKLDPYAVLDHTLQNWDRFAWEVGVQRGTTSQPSQPVIGFLLQYHDVAANMWLQAVAKKAPKAVHVVQPTQLVPTVPVVKVVPSGEELASKEYTLAMLAKYKAKASK